jgi:hypothetical protein
MSSSQEHALLRAFLKPKDFTHENKRLRMIQINDGNIFRHLVLPKTYKRGFLGHDLSVKRRPFCSAIVLFALPPRADSEPNETIKAGAACPGGNGPWAWSGLLCSRYHGARAVSPTAAGTRFPKKGMVSRCTFE